MIKIKIQKQDAFLINTQSHDGISSVEKIMKESNKPIVLEAINDMMEDLMDKIEENLKSSTNECNYEKVEHIYQQSTNNDLEDVQEMNKQSIDECKEIQSNSKQNIAKCDEIQDNSKQPTDEYQFKDITAEKSIITKVEPFTYESKEIKETNQQSVTYESNYEDVKSACEHILDSICNKEIQDSQESQTAFETTRRGRGRGRPRGRGRGRGRGGSRGRPRGPSAHNQESTETEEIKDEAANFPLIKRSSRIQAIQERKKAELEEKMKQEQKRLEEMLKKKQQEEKQKQVIHIDRQSKKFILKVCYNI